MSRHPAQDLSLNDIAAATALSDLARLLRELRRRDARQRNDSPWTYRELAARTGWSLGSISHYFTGKALPPTDRFDILIWMHGASSSEQSALATARDVIEEQRRHPTTSVASSVSAGIRPLIQRIEKAQIDRIERIHVELSTAKDLTYAGEDRDWLLTLTDASVWEISAISIAFDADHNPFGNFWMSDLGCRYLDGQVRALERGVNIRRIFLVNGSNVGNQANFRRTCNHQIGLNIDVRMFDVSAALPGLDLDTVTEQAIFDRSLCYAVTAQPVDAAHPRRLNTTMHLQQNYVNKHIATYELLWKQSQRLI